MAHVSPVLMGSPVTDIHAMILMNALMELTHVVLMLFAATMSAALSVIASRVSLVMVIPALT